MFHVYVTRHFHKNQSTPLPLMGSRGFPWKSPIFQYVLVLVIPNKSSYGTEVRSPFWEAVWGCNPYIYMLAWSGLHFVCCDSQWLRKKNVERLSTKKITNIVSDGGGGREEVRGGYRMSSVSIFTCYSYYVLCNVIPGKRQERRLEGSTAKTVFDSGWEEGASNEFGPHSQIHTT